MSQGLLLVSFDVCTQDALSVAKWLSALPEVTWVDRQVPAHLHG